MTELEEYLQTGILGGYNPTHAIVYRAGNEEVGVTFRDTAYWKRDGCSVRERRMIIGDRRFQITSVFPDASTATPTEKMLTLIDAEMDKKNQ